MAIFSQALVDMNIVGSVQFIFRRPRMQSLRSAVEELCRWHASSQSPHDSSRLASTSKYLNDAENLEAYHLWLGLEVAGCVCDDRHSSMQGMMHFPSDQRLVAEANLMRPGTILVRILVRLPPRS